MSQLPLTEEAHDRCIRLCDLIKRREVQIEVSKEIINLFELGVDINFQDFNRKKNTYLHFAATNSDVKCLEFLLKRGPNLELENEDCETPSKIADEAGRVDICELLERAKSTFNVILRQFVYEFEYENFSRLKLESIKKYSSFRILKIVNCPSINVLLNAMIAENFADVFRESPNFFIFDISVFCTFFDFSAENYEALSLLFSADRPLIIQISSKGATAKIFFKEESSKTIKQIFVAKPTATLLQKLQSKNECNFSALLEALQISSYGEFNGNILDIKLQKNNDRRRLTDRFASMNSLSLRFLKLFEESLDVEQWRERVVSVMTCKEVSLLKAFLDHPFSSRARGSFLPNNLREQILRVDSRNYNLLMIAVEQNNEKAVNYLIKFGFNLNHLGSNNETAVDLAWSYAFFRCLLILLENDSHFPLNFDISLVSDDKERNAIEMILKKKDTFHNNITKGKLKKVKKIVNSKPHMKDCYLESNISALTTALFAEQFEVYAYLRSEGFSAENDEGFVSTMEMLQPSDKEKIRDENQKLLFHLDKPYLNELLMKSKLSYNTKNKKDCFKDIREIYSALDEIPKVAIILRLIASSVKLKIVFDFNLEDVSEMDPSKSVYVRGTTYSNTGFIYVGGKDLKLYFQDIIATLAHEMCHYAMFLTYENDCLPFYQTDEENRKAYEEIYEKTKTFCENNPDKTNDVIGRVFKFGPAEDFARREVGLRELIVRVPHILVQYKGQDYHNIIALNDIEDLFEFYSRKVEVDMIEKCTMSDANDRIEKINRDDSLLTSIRNKKISLKVSRPLEDTSENELLILSTNSQFMTLSSVNQSHFQKDKGCSKLNNIILKVESLRVKKIIDNVKISMKTQAQPKVIIDCTGKTKNFEKDLIKFIKEMRENKRLVLIVSLDESVSLTKTFWSNEIPNRSSQQWHSWQELDDKVQKEKIKTKVNFQGHELELSKLIPKSSLALREICLDSILTDSFFTIGQALVEPPFYIPRKFVRRLQVVSDESQTFDYERLLKFGEVKNISGPAGTLESPSLEVVTQPQTFEELLKFGETQKIVLISGPAGTGKTSSLLQFAIKIKKQNPTFWVSFVDLKQHVESFEQFVKCHDVDSFSLGFPEFFSETILVKEKSFDRELFKEIFSRGKAFILLDGFDEISPNYKELLLKALSSFDISSTNQLWVTTRPNHEKDLEGTTKQTAFNLLPLTQDDQVDQVVEFWWFSKTDIKAFSDQELNDCEGTRKRLTEKAKALIEKLSLVLPSTLTFIGLPMLVEMLAKLYADKPVDVNTNLNLLFIFDHLVLGKIESWMNKGESYKIDQTWITSQKTSVMNVHFQIALFYITLRRKSLRFPKIELCDLTQWTNEMIERIGIVRFDSVSGVVQFDHDTIAEYLVATFIFEGLKSGDSLNSAIELLATFCVQRDYQTIRSFLNQMLTGFKPADEDHAKLLCESANKKIDALRTFDLLSKVVTEPHHSLADFLLKICSKKTLKSILLNETYFESGSMKLNSLHSAAAFNDVEMVLLICNAAKRLDIGDRKSMYLSKGSESYTALHFAALNEVNVEMFLTLWDQMKGFLTDAEKKDILLFNKDKHNYLSKVFARGNRILIDSVFTALQSCADAIPEIKQIFVQKDSRGESLIQIGFKKNSKKNLQFLCNKLNDRKLLTLEEVQQLILEKDSQGRNIFHFIAMNTENQGVLKMFWKWLQESKIYSPEGIKSMVQHVSPSGENILHSMIRKDNVNAMTELFCIVQDFGYDERKSILFGVTRHNSDDMNCLQLALNFGNEEVFSCFSKILPTFLSYEDEKISFSTPCEKSCTVFHYAVANACNPNMLTSLYNYIMSRNFFSKEEIKHLLKSISEVAGNIFDNFGSDKSAFDKLVGLVRLYLIDDEMKKLLLENDSFEHAICFSNNADVLDSFFILIKSLIDDRKELKQLFTKCGWSGSNIFHLAATNEQDGSNEQENVFSTILSHLSGIFKDHEIRKLLLDKKSCNSNLLHVLFVFIFNTKTFDYVFLTLFKKFLVKGDLEQLLTEKDPMYQGNALHCAIKCKNQVLLSRIFQLIKDSIELENLKSLVKACGQKERNIFFYAAENTNKEIFSTLRECLKGVLTDDEVTEMLLQTDADGHNILVHSYSVNAERTKEIAFFLRLTLNMDDLRKIVEKVYSANNKIEQVAGSSNIVYSSNNLEISLPGFAGDFSNDEVIDLTEQRSDDSCEEIIDI